VSAAFSQVTHVARPASTTSSWLMAKRMVPTMTATLTVLATVA
jgi:hypothetical protein